MRGRGERDDARHVVDTNYHLSAIGAATSTTPRQPSLLLWRISRKSGFIVPIDVVKQAAARYSREDTLHFSPKSSFALSTSCPGPTSRGYTSVSAVQSSGKLTQK